MHAAQGTVYYLLSKSSSRNTCAAVITDFIETENKCLLLHYQWIDEGRLSIYMLGENLNYTLLKNVSSANDDSLSTWSVLFLALPYSASLQKIVIVGERSVDGTSGVVIDDFSIRSCKDFRKY